MGILFREYELLASSKLFDAEYYVRTNPDIAELNVDPLLHYLESGAESLRDPSADFDSAFYREQCRQHGEAPENPLLHYLTVGAAMGFRPLPHDAADVPTLRARAGSALAPLRLEIDDASVDDAGILCLSGWAVCLLAVKSIDVVVDGELIGTADYGRARMDVALACKNYPRARHSGFAFNADLTRWGAGEKTIEVRAVAQSGITRSARILVSVPDEVMRGDIDAPVHFHCDEVFLSTHGRVRVQGWLIGASTTESITVLLNGTELGRALIGQERPDVGLAFPGIAYSGNSGFSFDGTQAEQVAAGEHLLTLRVRDSRGGVRTVPLPSQALEEAMPAHAAAGSAAELFVRDGANDIALSIDSPRISNGVADTPIISSLSINGWALARAGIADIRIAIDGVAVAKAQHGIRRDDVANAFPDRPEALQSGFATLIPYWLLSQGSHSIEIAVRDLAEQVASVQFGIAVEDIPEGEGPWSLRRKMSRAQIDLNTRVLAGMQWRPWFCVLLALDGEDGSLADARRTLESLSAQAYGHWNVLLVSRAQAAFSKEWKKRLFAGLDELAGRATFRAPLEVPNFAFLAADLPGRWDCVLAMPLSAGDTLGCDALLELALASGQRRGADLFYGDERCRSAVTGKVQAYFKSGWSPDLLLSTNYVGRPWCAYTTVFDRARLTLDDWLDRGDYDAVLRATEAAQGIQHVAKVLCQRGADHLDGETAERQALSQALVRRRLSAGIGAGCGPGFYRIVPGKADHGRVSIVIPTRASRGLIKVCLETLKTRTAYRNVEIICIENIPADQPEWKTWLRENADIVLEAEEAFNWSRYNNLGAQRATGNFLLFLNDDMEILDSDWLDTLLFSAARSDVGIVGPQLLYPDRTVQHAGLALTQVLGRARHLFRHGQETDPGYFGLALAQRNVIAVTGACMLMRREVFDALEGFDEAYTVINNDLDFCLRAWRHGLLTVYTPHARLIHHEMVSRAKLGDAFDSAAFATAWRDVFSAGDPYLNRNLSRDSDDLVPEREPVTEICTGHPLFARESIRRILVVKVDHIGDCIISLPAIRKLKRHFPGARITVLSGTATKLVWSMEPAVDEVLEFNFFHARSQLGRLEVSEDELLGLRDRLAEHRFDAAVDLRKSPDTRHVLKYTGARYLAGFDHEDRFPWLDVALQWEGDPARVAKRQSAGDDLVNLVDALSASADDERQVLIRKPGALSLDAMEARGLCERPLVCVHAGAGNELKAWPQAAFCELIDLLVEREGVQVALVGGPAEVALSDDIIAAVRDSSRVRNLAGRLSLSALPDLFLRARLFIGNDSGPKHIAAALGVPTVGIHSGNIDPREWGPVGPSAVAVRREVSCSPCYIDKAADCPRNIACLKGIGAGAVYELCRKMLNIGSGGGAHEREGEKSPREPAMAGSLGCGE